MKLEIDVTKDMLNDMVKEYEIINSSCFMRKDEWQRCNFSRVFRSYIIPI